jgi:hypothetical protein
MKKKDLKVGQVLEDTSYFYGQKLRFLLILSVFENGYTYLRSSRKDHFYVPRECGQTEHSADNFKNVRYYKKVN